jgi:hypothetical protein
MGSDLGYLAHDANSPAPKGALRQHSI